MINQYEQIIHKIYDYLYPITNHAVDELSAALEIHNVQSVYELAVGSGRLSIPLSERGYEVSGVDSSEKMLSLLASRDVGGRVRASLGDMYSPATGESVGAFDAVLLMCNGLGIARGAKDQVRLMSAARTLVKEDGVLFIEMLNPLRYRHGAEQFSTARRLTPSIVLHSVIDVDWVHQSLNTINTIVDSSDIIGVYDEKLRFVYPSELELMAAASGFTVEILRSDWRGSPLESWSPGLAAVLRAE